MSDSKRDDKDEEESFAKQQAKIQADMFQSLITGQIRKLEGFVTKLSQELKKGLMATTRSITGKKSFKYNEQQRAVLTEFTAELDKLPRTFSKDSYLAVTAEIQKLVLTVYIDVYLYGRSPGVISSNQDPFLKLFTAAIRTAATLHTSTGLMNLAGKSKVNTKARDEKIQDNPADEAKILGALDHPDYTREHDSMVEHVFAKAILEGFKLLNVPFIVNCAKVLAADRLNGVEKWNQLALNYCGGKGREEDPIYLLLKMPKDVSEEAIKNRYTNFMQTEDADKQIAIILDRTRYVSDLDPYCNYGYNALVETVARRQRSPSGD